MVGKRNADLEGDLFPRGAAPSATPRVRKRDGQTLFGPQIKRARPTRPVENASDASVIQHGASLSTSRITVGMTVLALITKADSNGIEVAMPGALRGVVPADEFLVSEGAGKMRLENSDDDTSDESPDEDDNILRPAWAVVTVGRIVPAAVIDIDSNDSGRKVVKISLKPHLVNVGLNSAHVLSKGFTLWGAVKSVEDHGYVVSFGATIPHTGFLPFEKHSHTEEERLAPGCPILVVTTEEVKTSRQRGRSFAKSVRLSSLQSDVLGAVIDRPDMTYEDLNAGMLFHSRVLQVGPGGVSLSAFGLFKVDVDASHVPRKPDGTWNVVVGKSMLTRVIYVDASRKRLAASLLDTYVTSLTSRAVPPLWKIGTRLKGLTVERVKPGFGLILKCADSPASGPENDVIEAVNGQDVRMNHLVEHNVPIFAHISRISEKKSLKLESKYREGTAIEHGGRIVSVSKFDGLVNVDLRPSVLSRKALSLDEIEVGTIYDCKILSHTTMGSLMVAVDGDPYLPGVVLPAHISDVVIPSKRLGKYPAFRIGASLKCRVISIHWKKGKIFLTARKSLTSPKYPMLTSYDQAADALNSWKRSNEEGRKTCEEILFTGTTKRVVNDRNLIVEFIGGVAGLVPSTELCLDRGEQVSQTEVESVYPIHGTVHVRVTGVDPKRKRLYLSMSLDGDQEREPVSEHFQLGHLVHGKISAVDVELKHFVVVVSAETPHSEPDRVLERKSKPLNESLSTRKAVQCLLPFGHLSDVPGVAERLENELQVRLKARENDDDTSLRIPKATVLCYRNSVAILTLKTSLKTAVQSGVLPRCFDDVHKMVDASKEGNKDKIILRGYIKALLPGGAIVGFLGACVGFVRISRVADRFVSDPARALKISQSVSVFVEAVDNTKKRFYLSCRLSDVGQEGTIFDTISLFRDLQEWQKLLRIPQIEKDFPIGEVLEARRSAVSTYGVKYDLKNENTTAVGVVYGIEGTATDVGMNDAMTEEKDESSLRRQSKSKSTESKDTKKKEKVRILDVDPLTAVVDLSGQSTVVKGGSKKSVLAPGASFEATVLLVKSSYVILAVERSKSRSAIAYALGPVARESLMIRPGAKVKCSVLDKSQAGTRRNLVLVNWDSFQNVRRKSNASLPANSTTRTISLLRSKTSADYDSLRGMKIAGKVTKLFTLRAYVGVAPGVVGQIHILNTAAVDDEELVDMSLGIAPHDVSERFNLPPSGEHVKTAYVVGVRPPTGEGESDPLVVEMALCKGICSPCLPSDGQKVVGFVKSPSSRLSGESKARGDGTRFRYTLIAIAPTSFAACADVDSLSADYERLEPGAAVVCRLVTPQDDRSDGVKCILSENGKTSGTEFMGLVQAVEPGRGIRVEIPWLARDPKAKSVSWGFVDICDVADDFDQALKVMNELEEGKTVTIQQIFTIEDNSGTDRHRVQLSMRSKGAASGKDPLITTENVRALKQGASVRGFVRGIGKKGCFVSVGRNITAHVKLCDLSDEFVKDPKKEFPIGKLVSGVLDEGTREEEGSKISLVLRKRPRRKLRASRIPAELREGSKVSGVVRRIYDYGVVLEIAPGVTALLHKSEADQDRFIDNPEEEWAVGQNLTAIVIKCADSKISIGTKRCYFEAAGIDEDAIDQILSRNEELRDKDTRATEVEDVIEAETRLGEGMDEEMSDIELESDSDGNGKSDISLDEPRQDDSNPESTQKPSDVHDGGSADDAVAPLQISEGFDFTTPVSEGPSREENPEIVDRNASRAADHSRKSATNTFRNKREKKRLREAAETGIRLREEALANDPDAPQTSEDFERLLIGEPNSSVLWIRYMAFCLQLSQLDKARAVAERALDTISLNEETERVNVWCAYVNLEAQYGSMNSVADEAMDEIQTRRTAAVFQVFERACERITDVKSFHLQVAAALRRDFPKLGTELLQRAVRKFKWSSKVWIAVGQSQFDAGDIEGARKTLARALLSLERNKHVRLITKFAQFEYKNGNAERGRTVFESLVGNFPNRVDLWSIYLDMESSYCQREDDEFKEENVRRARELFERFASLDLSSKKMKFAFKKWLRFEKAFGSKESELLVKNRAREYVDRNTSSTGSASRDG